MKAGALRTPTSKKSQIRKSKPAIAAPRPLLPPRVRRARLQALIETQGFVSIRETATLFDVSEMTVRRDLDMLGRTGTAVRTHGGAIDERIRHHDQLRSDHLFAGEPAFWERRLRHADEKIAIARRAASLIPQGQAVALDVGTSALALATELAGRLDLHIFTNSLPAAVALVSSRCAVHILGGLVRGPELAVVGASARRQLEDYSFDSCFIGVSGVTAEGFHDYIVEDSEVKRLIAARSTLVTVLCDSSKFDRRGFARIFDLGVCHRLITERMPPEPLRGAILAAGVDIILADGVF